MTIMKSFWVVISYQVKGQDWWWYNAVMEINMLNALTRFVDHPIHYGLTITEHSDKHHSDDSSKKHWSAVDDASSRAPRVTFEVFMQDEQPPLVNEKFTLVKDNRPDDLRHQAIKQEKEIRSTWKKLPDELPF